MRAGAVNIQGMEVIWPLVSAQMDDIVATQIHLLNQASPVSVPAYRYPLLPELANSYPPPPSPRLQDSRHYALANAIISFNVALRYF